MDKYAYEILTHRVGTQGAGWYAMAAGRLLGAELIAVLQQAGEAGWEICGIGNVCGNDRAEIVLKQRKAG